MYQSQHNSSFYFCPRIKGSDDFQAYYGGNQSWLGRNTARLAGCAPTCGANIMTILATNYPAFARKLGVTLDKRNFISQDDYINILNGIYKYMGIFEIPWFNKRYDQSPPGGPPRFPVSIGTNMPLFVSGVKRFAKKNDILLDSRIMYVRNSSYYRGLAFIKLALSNGYPVVLLTSGSDFKYTMYDRPYMQGAYETSMKYHFVTITDVRDTAIKDQPDILITILGKTGCISYKTLYDSWQSPKAIGSSLCSFIPMEK